MAEMMQPPPVLGRAEQCSTCNAFYQIGVDSPPATGFCLRYPPAPLFGSHVGQPGPGVPQLESFFPIVDAGWWCREWAGNPTTKPAP